MDSTAIITFLACICVLFILGKIFTVPVKFLFKIILNSVFGGLLIFLINLVGSSFYFHIGLNLFTAIFVGILGIPRCYCVSFDTFICIVGALQ
ncbi:MAG: pro-sigmaK processing inhibitor BofA family protein [Oscillospiraceae bacterium]|nr:pro-sigmaK processing inhibitor BofA family protein [Oscillospiraceae bacterium]